MNFIKKHKNIFIDMLLFFSIFIVSLLVAYVIIPIWSDQIWSYSFSYNISKGMIIYRDFNVVQTPLYFFIASIFIKIFGNHMISTGILDSLLIAGTGLIMFKTIKWKAFFPLLAIIIMIPSPYNLFCTFLLMIILYLIHSEKYNDYLVALIGGLIFITKQNIGVLLFVPIFIYSKKKIKSTFIFLIPFMILCIYLLWNHAFFPFLITVF